MKLAKETILLVDDEVKVLSALAIILESSGYGVLTAADGHEARAASYGWQAIEDRSPSRRAKDAPA